MQAQTAVRVIEVGPMTAPPAGMLAAPTVGDSGIHLVEDGRSASGATVFESIEVQA
ncbi:hypothetical protein [Nocardia cerradoensis]|uniref:hypothetical protein n=1 Tax=Nocardia cerradoensis TaxID=85688 RepID=UPI0012F65BA9|nr:hypothetical protein [Nocardia cerradoensis]NKY43548.1 hypothetical protein [Nocardia cerradoensis]